MAKELKTQEVKELNTEVASFDMGDFMEDGLQQEDLRIEKVVLTQNNSTILHENKELKGGDWYFSVSKNKCASQDQEWEFIPLMVQPLVQVFKNKNGSTDRKIAQKGDFVESVKRSEFPKEREMVDKDFICYDVKSMFIAPIGDGFIDTLPNRIDFKSSNMAAFQPVITKIIQMKDTPGFNQTHLVFKISSKIQRKDNNSWYVFDVAFSRESTPEERQKVAKMMELIKTLDKKHLYNDTDTEGSASVEVEVEVSSEDLKNYAPES